MVATKAEVLNDPKCSKRKPEVLKSLVLQGKAEVLRKEQHDEDGDDGRAGRLAGVAREGQRRHARREAQARDTSRVQGIPASAGLPVPSVHAGVDVLQARAQDDPRGGEDGMTPEEFFQHPELWPIKFVGGVTGAWIQRRDGDHVERRSITSDDPDVPQLAARGWEPD
jgi:hypothetical protein